MLSVIGSLLGFASSAAPAVADHFRAKQDQKFELAKMEKMAQLRAADSIRNTACTAKADDNEHARLVAHDMSINSGTGIISGLQRSVRPIITYAFFALFVTIEVTLLNEALSTGAKFSEAINVLWDEDTKAIFAAIISFWFGSRAIDKARGR